VSAKKHTVTDKFAYFQILLKIIYSHKRKEKHTVQERSQEKYAFGHKIDR
jgi:hypothetical protein